LIGFFRSHLVQKREASLPALDAMGCTADLRLREAKRLAHLFFTYEACPCDHYDRYHPRGAANRERTFGRHGCSPALATKGPEPTPRTVDSEAWSKGRASAIGRVVS
jgi:hypothetical protein